MKVQFWGVRGSLPSSLDTYGWVGHFEKLMKQFFDSGFNSKSDINEFIKQNPPAAIGGFGAATTCVQVSDGPHTLIVDGGSGLKHLSDQLEKLGRISLHNEFHILMTHFHFDHILGLPFFAPHFIKGKKIHYYSVQPETEQIVRNLFKKPIFPVGFESLSADIQFHTLQPYKKTAINGFEVTAYKMDHPDPSYGFRIEKNNKVYAHAVDHEALRLTREQLGADAGLFEKADLLYFDAQYEEADMALKKGWGHGTCDRGFQVAATFGVQQILFAHHDPAFSIEDSWNHKKKAEASFQQHFSKNKLKWDFAFEGLIVEVKPRSNNH
ncbi:MAG: MBL fold metallo-hydrolase [Bdellovibrionaceae bacterium]|nr:MBL fold metallo-hydrolase [Bdellovibrio sp.]